MMTTKFYFENLSPGLRARLDANYRVNQRPFGMLNTCVNRTRFETLSLIPGRVGILKTTPIPQAR